MVLLRIPTAVQPMTGIEGFKTRFIFGEKGVINTQITKNLLKLPKDADKHMVVNPVKVIHCAIVIKLKSAAIHLPQLASKQFQFHFTGNFTI